jgi:hypothetical protein
MGTSPMFFFIDSGVIPFPVVLKLNLSAASGLIHHLCIEPVILSIEDDSPFTFWPHGRCLYKRERSERRKPSFPHQDRTSETQDVRLAQRFILTSVELPEPEVALSPPAQASRCQVEVAP